MKIVVINGPNINMLGIREPDIYGSTTYDQLCRMLHDHAAERGIELDIYQSNHEGDLIDRIQAAYGAADGIIINPGGYTHTSIALPDAVKAVGLPTVEVHISDPDSREDYRKIDYIREACVKTIAGRGVQGYIDAVRFLTDKESEQ